MVYFLLENSLDIFLLVDDTLINCVFFFYYDSKRISGNCSFLVHFKNMTGLFVGPGLRAYGLATPLHSFCFKRTIGKTNDQHCMEKTPRVVQELQIIFVFNLK